MQRPIIPLLIALASGITVGSLVAIPGIPTLVALLATLAALLFLVASGKKDLVRLCLLVSLFLLGTLNIGMYLHPYCGRDDIALHAWRDRLTIEGLVCTPPRIVGEKTRLVIRTARIIRGGTAVPVEGKILLFVKDSNNVFKYGNYIRAQTRLKEPHNFNNPGGFDYKRYLLYRGIRLRGYISRPSDIVIIRENAGNYLRTRIERYRSLLSGLTRGNSPSPEGGVLQALILGEKEWVPEEFTKDFNRAGVSHILAISGLHVGIIAFISFFIARTLMKSSEYLLLRFNVFKVSALFSVIPVIGYAFIAGLRISTLRATIMILCYLAALLAGRGRDLLNILAFAAFLILVISPAALFDVSFQLSFTAVATILLVTPALGSLIPQAAGGGILKRGMTATVLFIMVSLAAVIGTAPLIALYFNRISTIALLSNLLVIPIIGFAVLPVGMLLIVTAPLAPVASVLITVASFLIRIAVSIIGFLSSLPFSSLPVTTPTLLKITVYYLCVLTGVRLIHTWRPKETRVSEDLQRCPPPSTIGRLKNLYRARERNLLVIFLGLIALFFIADAFYTNLRAAGSRDLEATFIDVGQGSSTLIKLPGGNILLVDGGGFYDRSFDLGEYVVAPYLWREKIKKIDIMVLTHPDQDHAGGLPFIAENFEVGEIWSNSQESKNESWQRLLEIIRQKGIPHRIVGTETPERTVGGVSIRLLNPKGSASEQDLHAPDYDYNDNGIVMKITFGRRSILLPADISDLAEARLVASDHDLRADILMVPHHGGYPSSTEPVLRAVRPEIAVISCGPDNTFGFPHPTVLARYTGAGARVLRTDTDGAIIVRTDGEMMEIRRPR
ncbi:MAG: DNA internalization-related competence protein ComEC/Rec2 [Syntrophobacterales bacterium]|nr:MAG: DNA internalization-related competence protein ComEC/Rec2 [Syntrophobacterales bacterium]